MMRQQLLWVLNLDFESRIIEFQLTRIASPSIETVTESDY